MRTPTGLRAAISRTRSSAANNPFDDELETVALWKFARERDDRVQIVYMSGYAEGLPEAQLPENSTFLQKPFRFATLLEQLKLVRRRV
jgi:hypothetical protein